MKHFKIAVSVIILMLMLTPFISFAAKAEQRGANEPGIAEPELMEAGQANGKGQNQASDRAIQRRSIVANAVQEMLKVAGLDQGVGRQIRTIAQAQNQNQEQIEATMKQVKNRGRLKKFFFGPDYKNLNSAEDRLANHTEKLEELKDLAAQITNQADAVTLLEQIEIMEQIDTELLSEVAGEKKGFSLFGWLNKWLSK